MQNSNEEDFKKKYLKYKAKYLELKELLEGGIPSKKACSQLSFLECANYKERCVQGRGVGCRDKS